MDVGDFNRTVPDFTPCNVNTNNINMNPLLAISMAFLAFIVFLLFWKSIDWFDQIINNKN
jgi:hypothetical protein